jgi:outer membrane protein OmpA-like peptidoglycan-associated protein
MRFTCFNHLPWLLFLLPAYPVVGQSRLNAGGTSGTVPGIGTPAAAPRPDVPVAPSRGAVVAGHPPAGSGLRAAYHASAPRGAATYSRIEPGVGVTWRGSAPAPGVPGQGFSVRWTGYVRAPETGVYVLHTEWDDATDIYFAGENVLAMERNDMAMFGPNQGFIPVDSVQYFTSGQFYRIDLAYKNVQGVSRAVLAWARPSELGHPTKLEQTYYAAQGHRYTIIPQEFLYPELPRPAALVAASAQARRPATAPVVRRRATTPPVAPRRSAPVRPVLPAATPVPLPALATLLRGTAVALPSLYFTQSTADLLPTSRPTLNALARELRQRPALRLEIAGHTDNVGQADRNLRLSQQRAQVVRRYLVQQGIDSLRLTARGYGGTRPVADNRDSQQRTRNRRVEVVVQ